MVGPETIGALDRRRLQKPRARAVVGPTGEIASGNAFIDEIADGAVQSIARDRVRRR